MSSTKNEKDIYFVRKNFHSDLEGLIKNKYDINVLWSKVMAWGYQTVSIYFEDQDKNKYIAKVTKYSKQKAEAVKRSIEIEHYLNDVVPTASYLKNTDGDYITLHSENRFIRLQHHIEGVTPFDMNRDTYDQVLNMLHKIHQTKPPKDIRFDTYKNEKDNELKLLHGDPTPSNILISYGTVTGILDFEDALLGPVEYDISRFAVFSYYYMSDTKFEDLINHSMENYNGGKLSYDFLISISIEHLNERVKNLELNKDKYENPKDWKADKENTANTLKEIEKLRN